MTLPATGAISTNNINVELRFTATAVVTLNDAPLRSLAAIPSGAISLNNFHSLQSRISGAVTIAANTQNYVFQPSTITGYVAGITTATLTISSGIVVGSSTTAGTALTVSGWTAGDIISIVNNGYIVGAGGAGASGQAANAGGGGLALAVSYATSITNNGTIGGGGGGGGSSSGYSTVTGPINTQTTNYYGGNGGGGGAGYNPGAGGPGGTYNGSTGSSGAAGSTTAGGGGAATGGALGTAGGSSSYAGGAAGACTSGNANITWVVAGTRAGALN